VANAPFVTGDVIGAPAHRRVQALQVQWLNISAAQSSQRSELFSS
jgi:hypothetical protein